MHIDKVDSRVTTWYLKIGIYYSKDQTNQYIRFLQVFLDKSHHLQSHLLYFLRHLYLKMGKQTPYDQHFCFSFLFCSLAQLCLTLETPQTLAHQAPLLHGIFPGKNTGGLPFTSPRDLPDPGVKLASPASPALQVDSLLLSHQGSGQIIIQSVPDKHKISTSWESRSKKNVMI